MFLSASHSLLRSYVPAELPPQKVTVLKRLHLEPPTMQSHSKQTLRRLNLDFFSSREDK